MKGNSKMPNNLRFWVYVNGGWAKLTLRYGDALAHCEGGATEEGYDWTETVWEHCGNHVWREYHREARDCDGRLTTGGICHADAQRLAVNTPHWYEDEDADPEIRFPDWTEGDHYQRDHAAEAAGY